MRKKVFVLISAVVTIAFTSTSCDTLKTTVKEEVKNDNVAVAEEDPRPAIKHVDANPEVISIAESIRLLESKDSLDAFVKKYGYKTASPYAIYRLDKYSTMLYKNCRLPKAISKNLYEDTPKPMAKGISSYVAISGKSITMAVFNNKAYENLLEQVLSLGFTLDMAGHEDKYTNGKVNIYVFKARKSFRIEKNL